jgi:hypothetical protein
MMPITYEMCELCEERPADLSLILTDREGRVLDTLYLCRGCFDNAGSLRSVLSPDRSDNRAKGE